MADRTIELHFQDGFDDDTVDVLVDGASIAAPTLKTKHQLGLAHIQPVALDDGQTIALLLHGADAPVRVPRIEGVDAYVVRKVGPALTIAPADRDLFYA